MDDLGFGVHRNPAKVLQVTRGGGLEGIAAVVGVTPVFGAAGLCAKGLDHARKRHFVGFPYPEVEKFRPGVRRQRRAFWPA